MSRREIAEKLNMPHRRLRNIMCDSCGCAMDGYEFKIIKRFVQALEEE